MIDERKAAGLFAIALGAMPLLAAIAPRALAGAPAVIGLVFWLGLLACRKRPARPDKSILIVIAGTLALALLSTLWSVDPGESWGRWLKTAPVLAGMIFLSGAIRALDARAMAESLRILPWTLFAAAAATAAEYRLHYPIYHFLNGIDPVTRINPSLLNRSVVGLTLCLMPALAAAGGRTASWLRPCLAAATALMAFSSDSQSAQLCLIGGAAFLLVFPCRSRWGWAALAAGMGVYIACAPWLAVLGYGFADSVNRSEYFGDGGAYGAQRLEIWHFIAMRILEHPWLGYGMEATRAMTFNSQKLFFDSDTVLHPHNVVLQSWLEFGAAGAACLFAACVAILRGVRASAGRARPYILALFMMTLAVASTTYGFWQGWWLGLLSLVAAYCLILEKSAAESLRADGAGQEQP